MAACGVSRCPPTNSHNTHTIHSNFENVSSFTCKHTHAHSNFETYIHTHTLPHSQTLILAYTHMHTHA